MKVQLLSFPGCPNVDAARIMLRRALSASRVDTEVEEIDTTAPGTPAHLRGWGSPTILIDGLDVAGEAAPGSATCRLYGDADGRVRGTPPEPLVRAALARAAGER